MDGPRVVAQCLNEEVRTSDSGPRPGRSHLWPDRGQGLSYRST